MEDTQGTKGEELFLAGTPDERRAQSRWINIARGLDSKRSLGLPDAAFDDPEDLLKAISEKREGVAVQTRWDVEEYLGVLAKIHTDQQRDLEREADHKDGVVTGEIITYGFNSEVANKVLNTFIPLLQAMNGGDAFTAEERLKASQSEQGLVEVVESALKKNPGEVYTSIDVCKALLEPEVIRQAVLSAKNNYYLLEKFDEVRGYFSPAEQKALVLPTLTNPKHAMQAQQKLTEVGDLFDPAELKQITVSVLQNTPSLPSYPPSILTNEDIQGVTLYRIQNRKELGGLDQFAHHTFYGEGKERITEEIVRVYTAEQSSASDLKNLRYIGNYISDGQKQEIVRVLMSRDFGKAAAYIEEAEGLVPKEVLKPLLQELIDKNGLDVSGSGATGILTSKVLDKDIKAQLVDSLIASGKADQALPEMHRWIVGWGDDRDATIRRVIEAMGVKGAIRKIENWSHFAPSSLVKEVVQEGSQSYENTTHLIRSFDEWANKADPEFTKEFLQRSSTTHPTELLKILPEVGNWTPDGKDQEVFDLLATANPALALLLTDAKYGRRDFFEETWESVDISKEKICNLANSDPNRLAFAPKTLRDFYKEILSDQGEFNFEGHNSSTQEAISLYSMIERIKALGLEPDFGKLQKSVTEVSANSEKEFLSLISCFAQLKAASPGEFPEGRDLGGDLEAVRANLLQEIGLKLGASEGLTQEQQARFFARMQTPTPLLTYLLQYQDSPAHKEILKGMFEGVVDGKYGEWKYGPDSQEGLDELKKAKLIPDSLTLEQYRVWRRDEQTSSFESLSDSVETVASSIREYLDDNLDHLGVMDVLDDLDIGLEDRNLQAAIKQELSTAGQSLADVNKRLSAARKAADPSQSPDLIADLEYEKEDLEQKRGDLVRVGKTLRLFRLTPKEVAAGCFLEGDDLKKRGEPLTKVFGELEEGLDQEDRFVMTNLRRMVALSGSSDRGRENLVCTDSSDPKVMIEVGENPVASCQSYDGGAYNECLLGYSGPDTKIVVLRNERDNIVARSVFRLLKGSDAGAALHLETIYSTSTNEGVNKSMFERVTQKATEMGLPVTVSKVSQNEAGVGKDADQAAGFSFKDVDYSLISEGSKAPSVYVDSAGGPKPGGVYRLEGLIELTKALP